MKNQNKIQSILEITLIISVLIFITIGCERKLTKVSEVDEEFESLFETDDWLGIAEGFKKIVKQKNNNVNFIIECAFIVSNSLTS